jgi:hypothetical protein
VRFWRGCADLPAGEQFFDLGWGLQAACRTRVTERFRRVDFGKLEIEVTVDDPKAYTRPWTVKLNHFIALDTALLDYFCLENEKDVVRLVGK